jgi:hypothetical protein
MADNLALSAGIGRLIAVPPSCLEIRFEFRRSSRVSMPAHTSFKSLTDVRNQLMIECYETNTKRGSHLPVCVNTRGTEPGDTVLAPSYFWSVGGTRTAQARGIPEIAESGGRRPIPHLRK